MLIYIGQYDDVADVSYGQNFTDIYQQYSLIKATTQGYFIVSETQGATSSLTD